MNWIPTELSLNTEHHHSSYLARTFRVCNAVLSSSFHFADCFSAWLSFEWCRKPEIPRAKSHKTILARINLRTSLGWNAQHQSIFRVLHINMFRSQRCFALPGLYRFSNVSRVKWKDHRERKGFSDGTSVWPHFQEFCVYILPFWFNMPFVFEHVHVRMHFGACGSSSRCRVGFANSKCQNMEPHHLLPRPLLR